MSDSESARDAARPTPARALGAAIKKKQQQSEYRTQVALAAAVGMSAQVVSDLITAARPLPWETVKPIAFALDNSDTWKADVAQMWRNADLAWRNPVHAGSETAQSPGARVGGPPWSTATGWAGVVEVLDPAGDLPRVSDVDHYMA
ncbi:helix-turn-helix domain-containing protein, partial [Nocardia salmonicida]|uniref:helix-turn-helix domain-containing protein n=1 Tax=Nocardia salmonicida TaxID=53431 RepID=UPI00365B40A5